MFRIRRTALGSNKTCLLLPQRAKLLERKCNYHLVYIYSERLFQNKTRDIWDYFHEGSSRLTFWQFTEAMIDITLMSACSIWTSFVFWPSLSAKRGEVQAGLRTWGRGGVVFLLPRIYPSAPLWFKCFVLGAPSLMKRRPADTLSAENVTDGIQPGLTKKTLNVTAKALRSDFCRCSTWTRL